MNVTEQIGEAAGEIWTALEGNQEGMTITQLVERTQLPKNLFHQGLGWLAREDKIQFSGKSNSPRVSLR